jgi:S-phase kinase-associated protein 1
MFTTFVVSEPKDIMTTLGSEEPMITLISKEGTEMKMKRRAAAMSNILNELLNDDEEENGEESEEEKIPLPINTAVLEKVIEYCNYHSEELAKTNTYYKRSGRTTMRSTRASTPRGRNRPSTKKKTVEEIEKDTQYILAKKWAKKWAKWDRQFIDSMFSIFSYFAVTKDSQRRNRTMLFDLLRAANFLDIKSLLDLTCVKVASMIQKDIGGDLDTTDLIYTLPVEMQLQIYSHCTYAQHAQVADKFKAQSAAIQAQSAAIQAQSAAIQAQSAALGETIEYRIKEMAEEGIRVPQDCKTLADAVKLAHDSHEHPQKYVDQDGNPRHLNKIVVGKGEHQIYSDDLRISSAMHIVGDPGVARKDIVIMGGIRFEKGIPGICHLQHLTLRQAWNGVEGRSSFTMEDVLVEQCADIGVTASGIGVVGRCTNVEVRQCGGSGVVAFLDASITLIGAKTTVHHNCTRGDSYDYGLQVSGSSATIQLVSPLTKEQVSLDNGGGGNWGAWRAEINQIKTINDLF